MDNQEHLYKSGHLLILMIWVQNVMQDLIILKRNPSMLASFNNGELDESFTSLRIQYLQKTFGSIKNEFIEVFPEIGNEYADNLNLIHHLRDFLSHARYRLVSKKLLFQPDKSRRTIQEKVESLTRIPFDISNTLLKTEMTDEKYEEIFNEIMKFESIIFPKIAANLSININRLK